MEKEDEGGDDSKAGLIRGMGHGEDGAKGTKASADIKDQVQFSRALTGELGLDYACEYDRENGEYQRWDQAATVEISILN